MILLSTTGVLPGYEIEEVHGIVTGHAVAGANAFKDLKGKFTDFFGGRSSTYEKVLHKYEVVVVEIMIEKAKEVGANAVLGISFDFEVMSFDGQMLMIMTTGTAMTIRKVGDTHGASASPKVPGQPRSSQGTASAATQAVVDDAGSDAHDTGVSQVDRYARDVDAELRERSHG